MKFSFLLAILWAFSPYHADDRQVDPPITFKIRKGFATVRGQFDAVQYRVSLDEELPLRIHGTAQVNSIQTHNTLRDTHLLHDTWFDAARFPQISIQSQEIVKLRGASGYRGRFDIGIKGKTRAKEIPFAVEVVEGQKVLRATFELSLAEFDLGGGLVSYLVGDQITIDVRLPL